MEDTKTPTTWESREPIENIAECMGDLACAAEELVGKSDGSGFSLLPSFRERIIIAVVTATAGDPNWEPSEIAERAEKILEAIWESR